MLLESKNRPPRNETKQSAERANRTTEKARYPKVEREKSEEQNTEEESLAEVGLLEAEYRKIQDGVYDASRKRQNRRTARFTGMKNRVCEVGKPGKHGEPERASEERKGIEPADDTSPENPGDQCGDEQVVLRVLPPLEAVGLDQSLAAFRIGLDAAHEVIQRAHGTDPTAKEASDEERRKENEEAQQKTLVESTAREGVRDADQRIDLEKQFDGRREVEVFG